MHRRQWLKVGAATGLGLLLAGGASTLWRPAWREGRMTGDARRMFGAVAAAVLQGIWPPPGPERVQTEQAFLERLEGTIAGFPPAMQHEVQQLASLLCTAPGRVALIGLSQPWAQASPQELAETLQSLRVSSLALRQQVFHALRDLCNAAYFADAGTWGLLGYPGPPQLGGAT